MTLVVPPAYVSDEVTPRSESQQRFDFWDAEIIKSQWLPAKLRQLHRFRLLDNSWSDGLATPPNAVAIQNAEKLLHQLASVDLEPETMLPCSDEGVSLDFHSGRRIAVIECFNTGDVLASTRLKGEQSTLWYADNTPAGLSTAVIRILTYLQK